MVFSVFPKSKFVVKKEDGTSFEMMALEATKGKMITVDHNAIKPNIIEENDIIEAIYTNGTKNIYRVIEPGFYEQTGPIPAHYQIKIEKYNKLTNTIPRINNSGNGNVICNFNSPNSNIAITQDLSKFDEIKREIEAQKDIQNKELLIKLIEELKNSTSDKNKFLNKYNEFVSALASHITIITPFIPYLSQFLPC
ncbi:TPA: hypothetical protein IAA87_08205 [Candidatus Avigastranaerophilus faecigallinarum]|nr:hypothetical protein [Candidatus Avigastranaerophilus faecigallinarum]